jgi:hypothetical protein
MQIHLKAAALAVALVVGACAGACGGGADEHEPSAPADDGAWMDDAIVVVERNEGTGRETVTLVDPASGFSLLVDDEPLTKGANETNVPSAPVAAVVVAALSNWN